MGHFSDSKSGYLLSFIFFGTLSLLLFESSAFAFNNEVYLQKCGGKIYPACNSEHLNQMTIYKDAERAALAENRKIFLVIGADWCLPCQEMNHALKAYLKLHKNVDGAPIVVKLAGSIDNSGYDRKEPVEKLLSQLNISYDLMPTSFLIDPKSKEKTKKWEGRLSVGEIEVIFQKATQKSVLSSPPATYSPFLYLKSKGKSF